MEYPSHSVASCASSRTSVSLPEFRTWLLSGVILFSNTRSGKNCMVNVIKGRRSNEQWRRSMPGGIGNSASSYNSMQQPLGGNLQGATGPAPMSGTAPLAGRPNNPPLGSAAPLPGSAAPLPGSAAPLPS
eukprot:4924505-Amphidinium_carterae.1